MRRLKTYLLCSLFTASASLIMGQAPAGIPVHLSGYVHDRQAVLFTDNPDSLITSNLVHNRINLRADAGHFFSIRVEIRNRVYYGEQVKMIHEFGKVISKDNGFLNLNWLWADRKSLVGVSGIDRLLVNFSASKFNITAGRQRINWGVTTIWNPNDIFNAYNFLDADYVERPGSDALRVQYYPAGSTSIELAVKPSREKDLSIAAALFRFNKWKYDFQVMAGIDEKDLVVGAGWAGNISKAGFKGEFAYFRATETTVAAVENSTATVMVDYALEKGWYVSLASLYVENPDAVALAGGESAGQQLSAKSLMPFEFSFYAGIIKALTPIISGNLALIYSPTDNTSILFPTIIYNLQKNTDLELSAQCFFSDRTGDFKTMGNSIFLRLKWNF